MLALKSHVYILRGGSSGSPNPECWVLQWFYWQYAAEHCLEEWSSSWPFWDAFSSMLPSPLLGDWASTVTSCSKKCAQIDPSVPEDWSHDLVNRLLDFEFFWWWRSFGDTIPCLPVCPRVCSNRPMFHDTLQSDQETHFPFFCVIPVA
jgi:hypothetical protein